MTEQNLLTLLSEADGAISTDMLEGLATPEILIAAVQALISEYKPAIKSIGLELLSLYQDLASNQELPETTATLKHNQYQAYITAGFTPDQAMQLLTTGGGVSLTQLLPMLKDAVAN